MLLIKDWNVINKANLLRTFLLPLWLVVGLTPYVFLLALVAGYSELFFDAQVPASRYGTSRN